MRPACAGCDSISCACSRWRRARALLQRTIARIAQYGWHIKIFIGPEELPDTIETLRTITAVPVVIDHMARLKPTDGARNPAHDLVLELLRRENFWVLLSNGARMSAQASRLGRRGADRP